MPLSEDCVPANYKLPEAARVLNCSINHVRNLMESGVLKQVKVGVRASRVRRDGVDSLAVNGLTPAQARLLVGKKTDAEGQAE